MTQTAAILLAEHDAVFAHTAVDVLERANFSCAVAADGAHAIALLDATRFDVAIVDLGIDANGGTRLIRNILARDAHLPVIALVTQPTIATAIECIDLAVAAYLTQPLNAANLVEQVRAILSRSRSVSHLEEFVAQTMRSVNDSLRDLTQLTGALRRRAIATHPCQLMNCPRGTQLRAAIRDAIEVLEATKGAFKSKALGDLRHRLELILDAS